MLGYFAQFVFGKGILHISVYRFIAVGFHGELLQLVIDIPNLCVIGRTQLLISG